MDDELSVGREPRRRHGRPRPRTVLVAVAAVAVAVGAGALVAAHPWRGADPSHLAATGRYCTVPYGSDFVVAAVEVGNTSRRTAATLSDIGVDPSAAALRRVGGQIDIVTGEGCEHVLSLRGDVVAPGERTWLGITVQVDSCRATTVPVRVGYRDGSRVRGVTVTAAVGPRTATACDVPVGAGRGGRRPTPTASGPG